MSMFDRRTIPSWSWGFRPLHQFLTYLALICVLLAIVLGLLALLTGAFPPAGLVLSCAGLAVLVARAHNARAASLNGNRTRGMNDSR